VYQTFLLAVHRVAGLALKPFLSIVVMGLIFLGGCTPLRSWLTSSSTQSSQTEPVAPYRPSVSQSFAYARYMAMNLSPSVASGEWTEVMVRHALVDAAQSTQIPVKVLLQALRSTVPASMQRVGEGSSSSAPAPAPAAAATVPAVPDATSPNDAIAESAPETGKGATLDRIAVFERQLQTCTEISGQDSLSCCRALAWPMAVLPKLDSISSEQAQKLWDEAPQHTASSSYRLQGIKAWLSICHGLLTQQPATLAEFRERYMQTKGATHAWSSVLHPRSPAKRGPRRIYSRSDGALAYAETLNPRDCSIMETEIIARRADGSLNFWVYDGLGNKTYLSHFPKSSARSSIVDSVEKPSPDSCMGCHYQLKERHFDVMFPSAAELNLAKTNDLPILCKTDNDTVVVDGF